MKKFIIKIKQFIMLLFLNIANLRNLSLYKERISISSIATGKIIPAEKHTSLHVKNNIMNAKFNILLSEGSVYVPFDCEIVEISKDLSTIILKTNEPYHYAIYIDKCCKYLKNNIDYSNFEKGYKFSNNQRIFNIDINAVYKNGYLPIVSFCIFSDFEYQKILYGNTIACSNTALIYY